MSAPLLVVADPIAPAYGAQLYAYSDARQVGLDDLAEFGTARVAADG